MLINLLKAKIHRATVKEANLDYIGSITLDQRLLNETGIYPNEKVQVVNINNGVRIETYVISGDENSGICCLNGAAARHFQAGDKIIIMAYCWKDESEVAMHKPKLVFVDKNNQISIIKQQEQPLMTFRN